MGRPLQHDLFPLCAGSCLVSLFVHWVVVHPSYETKLAGLLVEYLGRKFEMREEDPRVELQSQYS